MLAMLKRTKSFLSKAIKIVVSSSLFFSPYSLADRAAFNLAIAQKNPRKAFEIVKPMAEGGDKWAQGTLAVFYLAGFYLPHNPERARQLAEQGAGDNAQGDTVLAMMVMNGIGGPTDKQAAGRLLKRWLDSDTATAELYYTYGVWLLRYQDELRPDLWPEARRYALRAADMGYVPSYSLLGDIEVAPIKAGMMNTNATAAAQAKALLAGARWYLRAVEEGGSEEDLSTYLRYIAHDGSQETIDALNRLADAGFARCQGELAYRYLKGAPLPGPTYGAKIDTKKAESYARRAIAQGGGLGHYVLGMMYMDGYLPQSTPKAIQHLQTAAAAGEVRAYEELHYIYDRGINVPVDHAQARQWLEKGVEAGKAAADNGSTASHYSALLKHHDYQVAAKQRASRSGGAGSAWSNMGATDKQVAIILGVIGAAAGVAAMSIAKGGGKGSSSVTPDSGQIIHNTPMDFDGLDELADQAKADYEEQQRLQRCGVGTLCN